MVDFGLFILFQKKSNGSAFLFGATGVFTFDAVFTWGAQKLYGRSVAELEQNIFFWLLEEKRWFR